MEIKINLTLHDYRSWKLRFDRRIEYLLNKYIISEYLDILIKKKFETIHNLKRNYWGP